MNLVERIGLTALHRLDPETAHQLAIAVLRSGLAPLDPPVTSDALRLSLAGLDLPNPTGLAAGFDKNATALPALARSGFGFVEVGGVTPQPQPGNPRPRLFRLPEDQAVINRFGLNSDGMEAVAPRLANRPKGKIVGLNLGANKDSDDRAMDYKRLVEHCGPHLDYATVNVSSPNTEKLRDLQGKAALAALLDGVMESRARLPKTIPIFLKIAPDLSLNELDDIAATALEAGVDAIVATNTTVSRTGLQSPHRDQAGGLSGAPLFEASTRVLAHLYRSTNAAVPLIGVGGVDSAETAYAKIRAGASALQLYSALIYKGFSLVDEINRGLEALLAKDGFDNVTQATGAGNKDWT